MKKGIKRVAGADIPECTGCHRREERATDYTVRTIRLVDGECRACREAREEVAAADGDIAQALEQPGIVLRDTRTDRLWLVCVRQRTHRHPMLAPLGKAHQRDDYMAVRPADLKHFTLTTHNWKTANPTYRDQGYHCKGAALTARRGKLHICEQCGTEVSLNDYPAK